MNQFRTLIRSCLLLPVFLVCLSGIFFTAAAQQTSVSAADYSQDLAPGAIAAAFGTEMASATSAADRQPLPTVMAGTRVLVNGKAAPLFFVSANQINYQIPPDAVAGNTEVVIEKNGVVVSREQLQLRNAAFTAFSLDQSGSGTGAILDGRTYKLGPFDVFTSTGERTILAMYGTGLGNASGTGAVSGRVQVSVGGISARILYAGAAPGFTGLDQINFEMPEIVAEHGTIPVSVSIDHLPANNVTVDVMTAAMASVSLAFSTSSVNVQEGVAVGVSPFTDIDKLLVTLKSINLVSDKGVEVSLLNAPLTIDLLSAEGQARLLRVAQLKAGTYIALTAEIADVKASYKGQSVPIKLAKNKIEQRLKEPIKLNKDSSVAISLRFDVRASVRKQDDGTYVFDAVFIFEQVNSPATLPGVQVFSAKIAGIDKTTKQLKVVRTDAKDSASVVVDASQATIINEKGEKTDFTALAVDQKIDVGGTLNEKGIVVARVIYIGGIRPPVPPVQTLYATGTILAINPSAKTLEFNAEIIGGPTLLPAPNSRPQKITVRWDDKTIFREDLRSAITAGDLKVGQRASITMTAEKESYLASVILVIHPRIQGTIADVSKLPSSFIVSVLSFPYPTFAPVGLMTINIKAETKIRNAFNEELKPESLIAGNLVDILTDAINGNSADAGVIILLGASYRGTVVPADVKATDRSFVLTQLRTGLRVTVKLDDKSILFGSIDASGRPQQLKADEFIKLLLNRPSLVDISGILDGRNSLRCLSARLDNSVVALK
jgi:uncharacterized protein (TIGR03437 family)